MFQGPFNANQRYSWADSSVNQPSSFTDLSNINLDGSESNTSSPGLARVLAKIITLILTEVVISSIYHGRDTQRKR